MSRYIDADVLIAWIKGSQQMTSKMKSLICYIKTMPTVQTKEIKYYDEDEKVWKIGEVVVKEDE